jgi:hypothetical protein
MLKESRPKIRATATIFKIMPMGNKHPIGGKIAQSGHPARYLQIPFTYIGVIEVCVYIRYF